MRAAAIGSSNILSYFQPAVDKSDIEEGLDEEIISMDEDSIDLTENLDDYMLFGNAESDEEMLTNNQQARSSSLDNAIETLIERLELEKTMSQRMRNRHTFHLQYFHLQRNGYTAVQASEHVAEVMDKGHILQDVFTIHGLQSS